MELINTPEVIDVLNDFELSLIQIAKFFQQIIKLKPYSRQSISTGLPALKGSI